ncbi:MAG: hypothetical protein A3J48_01845 [Candidatus Doudnabacteria bacterium RIFCSPHIGHO2_02_FULL_46_11]|uniref:Uncharacterized protein n=1 Tax=Candidatus Doudnabacteria bacterium RIFCSPHIGHO2_02_FULL_46_11 TaxID=1817832 RepID=A0A1F5P9T3_9BACT|nr:MAG: hypothetical protein A3J48_01845 [Candidatus Doudnabacteria bacterium RIFCSPHIGHO2_02_FULL_46_11]
MRRTDRAEPASDVALANLFVAYLRLALTVVITTPPWGTEGERSENLSAQALLTLRSNARSRFEFGRTM